MIKIALKHWIYEKCIDVLFKTIGNNFCPGHKQNIFRPGNTFGAITIKIPNIYNNRVLKNQELKLMNCTIVDNLQGTVLIGFYATIEIGHGIEDLQIYNPLAHWRTNITDIINYSI